MHKSQFESGAYSRRRGAWVFAALILSLLLYPARVRGQEVQVYVSSAAGDRLAAKTPVVFASKVQAGPAHQATFRISENLKYQKMLGFGASFLEAGMICLNSLDARQQESVLRAIFDPENGAGFSAMKTVISSTDFMSAGPWYTYDDTPGDEDLKHFSIQRDIGPNGLVTYIKRARKYGSFILQAPMDYPPDWMLYDVNTNQDVNPKYYDALARYYLRYLDEYQKQGVFIDYLSLFNEPGEYTKIPYWQIRDLLKNHVGPLLKREGVKTRIQLSEAPFRGNGNGSGLEAFWNYPTVLDDPEARKYVAALPYHGYDFTRLNEPPTRENGYDFREFKKLGELHKRYPDLPLWMTEVCFFSGGTPWVKPMPRDNYEDSDFWLNQIASDLEAGSSGWTYWNLILDQHGGPWLISPIHQDPDNNVQQPVVIIDRDTHKISYTGVYYAIAHFSKFVRPGSIRIGSEGSAEGIRCLAFIRPDGRRVTELINSRKSDSSVQIEWQGKLLELSLPPISVSTLLW